MAIRPRGQASWAERKPLKQVLNKQSGEETVCGFSVQIPLPSSLLLSRAVHGAALFYCLIYLCKVR